MMGDLLRVREMLDEIFNSTSTVWPYVVTGESPEWTLEETLLIVRNDHPPRYTDLNISTQE